jgi:hypothetical protein
MKYMSFMLTTRQFRERTKGATRRLNWPGIKTDDVLMGVVKCMGFQKGESVQKLGPILIGDHWWEPLNAITQEECVLEGFPEMSPAEFVAMFCLEMKCKPSRLVHRIGFAYLDKYQPSNGTEGYAFMARYCDRCWSDRNAAKEPEKGCQILLATMLWGIADPGYPDEWVTDGTWPGTRCTKFQSFEDHNRQKKPYKPRVSKAQMVLL